MSGTGRRDPVGEALVECGHGPVGFAGRGKVLIPRAVGSLGGFGTGGGVL